MASKKKQKLRIYLSGTISEVDYRDMVHDLYGKDFDILDPLIENAELQEEKETRGNEIVEADKRLIEESHVLVAILRTYTAGTIMEIKHAHDLGLPVFIITRTVEGLKGIDQDIWVKYHSNKAFFSVRACFAHIKKKEAELLQNKC